MNIHLVLADAIDLDPAVDLARVKRCGPLWGSWRTWRACQTDNVVCYDPVKAMDLVKAEFQNNCNLYIPKSVQVKKGTRVNQFEGNFGEHVTRNHDELIAVNLASTRADIVLLLGFDWATETDLTNIQERNYRGLVLQAIKSKPDVQYILVDHTATLRPELQDLPNLDRDTLTNIFGLLNV